MTPYVLVSRDYWRQPREVCVVDEINCLSGEDAEVVVAGSPDSVSVARVKRWLGRLPIEFSQRAGIDDVGPYVSFVCSPLRAKVDPIAHALNQLEE